MTSKPLLIFDFDGVIVDGMSEYWWSSRKACIELLANRSESKFLPKVLPEAFRYLRPWVNQGWEMVLLVAELVRPNSQLALNGPEAFASSYSLYCQEALDAWQWTPEQLQEALENVRNDAISTDLTNWLALHKPFPAVIQRLKNFDAEGIELAVLTTKAKDFTVKLLHSFHLTPKLIYGHESGTKPEVLLRLTETHLIKGFVEDRRTTLETVLQTKGLAKLPCYLASWGYLKPQDTQYLPEGLRLLNPKTLATPLASWH